VVTLPAINVIVVIVLVLYGPGIDAEHCILESIEGHVTVHPLSQLCFVNGEVITKAQRLKQGRMPVTTVCFIDDRLHENQGGLKHSKLHLFYFESLL
jgi:hypothetical protein